MKDDKNTLRHDHAARKEAEEQSKKLETLSAPFDPLKQLANLTPFVTEEEADAQVPTSPVGEYRIKPMVPVVPLLEDDGNDQGAPKPLTGTTTPYTSYKGETERKLPFPELIAVFGPDTVRSYLRVALYAGAVENWDVQRSDMVKALDTLNRATNRYKEEIVFD